MSAVINWNPGTLLATSGQYWQGCALHAGVKLDLFTVLGESQSTAAAIAEQADCAPRSLTMLLRALAAMGLLIKSDDTYANTPFSRKFLDQKSDDYLGHIIQHHHHLMASWAQLPQAVRHDQPMPERITGDDPEVRRSFLMGMFNMAGLQAEQMAASVDLGQARHLLDLGGGPGTYAIYFCRANPELRATVFDLPATRPFAEETIDRFQLTDRIQFQAGDYLQDVLEGQYDAVWLSHILHGEGPDACQALISKAVGVLNPGGQIIIHDFVMDDTEDGPIFPALFALNMLLGTDEGQTYTHAQIHGMLSAAGITDIRRLPYPSPNDASVIVGTC